MSKKSTNNELRIRVDGEWRFVDSIALSDKVIPVDSSLFLIQVGSSIREVFVDAEGKYSDGNQLNAIEIKLESTREALIRERFGSVSGGTETTGSPNLMTVKAPMPGLVRSISIKIGDTVEKNTTLLVLEAMKMENNISASARGTVRSILVEAGMTVDKNARLVELDRLA